MSKNRATKNNTTNEMVSMQVVQNDLLLKLCLNKSLPSAVPTFKISGKYQKWFLFGKSKSSKDPPLVCSNLKRCASSEKKGVFKKSEHILKRVSENSLVRDFNISQTSAKEMLGNKGHCENLGFTKDQRQKSSVGVETVFRLSGFPRSEELVDLNGNYVALGSKRGKNYFYNRSCVFVYFSRGMWQLGTKLWGKSVIGYSRDDLFSDRFFSRHKSKSRVKSRWRIVEPSGEISNIIVFVEKISLDKEIFRKKVVLIDWYIEPKFVEFSQNRVSLVFHGARSHNKTPFKSAYVSKRIDHRNFLTIDGVLVQLVGKLNKEKSREFFRPCETKFLILFEQGMPKNFIDILMCLK